MRPRGGDWLEDEIRGWKTSGIDSVVSLLTEDEVAGLNLENEPKFCKAHGLRYFSFPVIDRGVAVPETVE